MNPATLFRLKSELKAFQQEHPKFTAFLRYAAEHGLREGNVLEVTIRQPDGKEVRSNLRLSEDDVRMLQDLRETLKTEQ